MEYTNIKYSIENGIAHLVLARDDIRNAFSEQDFTDEMVDAIERTQLSEEARVLVLSAEGSAFSAGGNIKDMKDKKGIFGGGPAGTRRGYIEGIQKVPKALYTLDIPSISAVQGPAIG
ncbi:MAG: enoyl-CoA hydratase-related protein, partial [Alphaproteobacteria bacterium]